jgi:hypothetical protein
MPGASGDVLDDAFFTRRLRGGDDTAKEHVIPDFGERSPALHLDILFPQ